MTTRLTPERLKEYLDVLPKCIGEHIAALESDLDAARRECITGREAYMTLCPSCTHENDQPARDAYAAARAANPMESQP